jgi:dynein heavy chain, axonemal
LEPFDDTEYDCRLPEEWIEYGNDPVTGAFNPIPGKGLFRDEQGRGYWRPVLISSYEKDRNVFTGNWDDEANEYCELTRINLLFNAEDPRIFSQRVAQAHQERIFADSQIRYNFFIDNMPTLELPELDSEQQHRIITMALSARFLKEKMKGGKDDKSGGVDTTSILSEVNLDYGRTMNWIIIDKTMEKPANELKDMIQANLSLPPKPPAKEVPQFGMVPIPQHDFPEQFSNFCFNSLFIKEEVIKAMVEIRAECNQLLLDNHIYDVSVKGKTLRVEEFK